MSTLAPILLPPLSAVYGAIIRSRLHLYRNGTFRTSTLPAPVISVGNITVGGTGKTPLVEWVARVLAEDDKKVCILTRGYGRKNANEHVLVSDRSKVFSNATEAGDEALLLAERLIGKAAVMSDANRFAAGEGAIKHLGTNCFVLDDGFQHLRLARDLDIVTIDATNPWGSGHLLPYGRLREPLSSLSRADCIVVTRADQTDNSEITLTKLAELTNAPVFLSRMRSVGLESFQRQVPESAERCFAFCGIGNPQSFFSQLGKQKIEIVNKKTFADHHNYTQKEIESLVETAQRQGANCLVTTEKDAVKLRTLSVALPCYFLRIEIEIENSEALRELLIAATKI